MTKESLSEYGSGWGWDNDYTEGSHVFSQEYSLKQLDEYAKELIKSTPYRLINNGKTLMQCDNEVEYTNGELLSSFSVMHFQESCRPNTGNAGNNYSFPSFINSPPFAEQDIVNSVCSRGWALPSAQEAIQYSFYNLIRNTYNIKENDESIARLAPLSLIWSGRYYGSHLDGRGSIGMYWTSTVITTNKVYKLLLDKNYINPISSVYNDRSYSELMYNGYSLRCGG